jgi:hypothetical protein
MDLYGVPRVAVETIAATSGCVVRAALEDHSAGPDWESYRYVVSR